MKLMQRARLKMVEMELAANTRRVYARWMAAYVRFHLPRHPAALGVAEIAAFLAHLSTMRNLSASAGNQALDAIRLLYAEVLGLPAVAEASARLRAKTRWGLPETASKIEILAILDRLEPKCRLMAYLCYGSGLTIGEVVRLHIGDIDLGRMEIHAAGRRTMVAALATELLAQQVMLARVWPGNVDGYLFPSSRLHDGRCWFVSESTLQKAMRRAVLDSGLARRISPKVLRYSFVLHLLEARYDVRTVQELAGFSNVKQVLVYQKMLDKKSVVSPIDLV